MQKMFKTIAFLTLVSLTNAPGALAAKGGISKKEQGLRDAMRELWMDHAIWTHEYIVAAATDSPGKQPYANRLLKNQDDIGNAVAMYYGKKAGDELTKLLKEHIMIAVDVVSAAKAGDDAKLKASDKKWHANADQIATFLSKANPASWPMGEMKAMMYEHLKLTTQETVAQLKSNWNDLVSVYDQVRKQLLGMADMLTNGIVKQFPKQF